MTIVILWPAVLGGVAALYVALVHAQLTPLFNSLPLRLHNVETYVAFAIISHSIVQLQAALALRRRRERVSVTGGNPIAMAAAAAAPHAEESDASVGLAVAALSAAVASIVGRYLAVYLGHLIGPEWGAVATRWVLTIGFVCGIGSSIPTGIPLVVYLATIYAGDLGWGYVLAQYPYLGAAYPERSLAALSLLVMIIAIGVGLDSPEAPSPSPAVKSSGKDPKYIGKGPKARPLAHRTLNPTSAARWYFLLSLNLLLVGLQISLSDKAPFSASDGNLRVLSSVQSNSGRIVVADNLRDEFRFLRADHSILGGVWIRQRDDGKGGTLTEQGDSVFAAFPLQEVAILAERGTASAPSKEAAMVMGNGKALVIGLGVGIGATYYSRQGMAVDVVEFDSAVYEASKEYFNLASTPLSSVHLVDGAAFVREAAEEVRNGGRIVKWDYIVQDTFSAGSLPVELFTHEFWCDVQDVLSDDGIVVMNFAGLIHSPASRAVMLTLTNVFAQCRIFEDNFASQGHSDVRNFVFICSKSYATLLTFRPPKDQDLLRSPLRARVYTGFLGNEVAVDEVLQQDDRRDPSMVLRRGAGAKHWDKELAMRAWTVISKLLPPSMWIAY